MRYRITVRGKGTELRGYIEAEDLGVLGTFATVMKPFGITIASPAEPDYDPFNTN